MIEIWCEKMWRSLSSPGRKPAARNQGVQPAVWIVVIVALLAGVRLCRELYRHYAGHHDEIATAIGSIGFLYGSPHPDASGKRVLYLQTSEKGLAISDSDVASRKSQILQEWPGPGIEYMDRHNQVSPFSPDGALFAYAFSPEGQFVRDRTEYVAVCAADTGAEQARFQAPDWNVTDMTWLAPDTLLCRGSTTWDHRGPLYHHYLIQKNSSGQWLARDLGLELTDPGGLMRLSSNTFAWVDDDGLRAMNLDSNSIATLFWVDGKRFTDCSLSPATGDFLITCKGKNADQLWRLQQDTNAPDAFSQLTTDKNIHNARWVNAGKGYAYLDQDELVVNTHLDTPPFRLAQADMDAFETDAGGQKLFFIGAVDDDPWAGLWKYDVTHQTMTNIVSYSDRPSPYAVDALPVRGFARVEGRRQVAYYVYKPLHFDRHKKYPLLIGYTPYNLSSSLYQNSSHGPSWAVAMADCGAYVVIVDRNNWFGGIDQWGDKVMDIYNHLINDPTIDRDRVYLYSISAETTYMSDLVEDQPERWKGCIWLGPEKLPDLSNLDPAKRLPAMLITVGAGQNQSDRFDKFQAEACSLGIPVEVVEHENTRYFLISVASVRERTRAMVDFVFNKP